MHARTCKTGAFAVGSALSYRPFFDALQREVADACPGLQPSLLSVEYTLAPDQFFPAQLHQCLAAYRWLVADQGRARVLLGGDSAGGNLVVCAGWGGGKALLEMRDMHVSSQPPARTHSSCFLFHSWLAVLLTCRRLLSLQRCATSTRAYLPRWGASSSRRGASCRVGERAALRLPGLLAFLLPPRTCNEHAQHTLPGI